MFNARREPLEPTYHEYQSRALPLISKLLTQREKAVVVDLGPASGSKVDFLSAFRCKVFIENFHDSLVSYREESSDGSNADSLFHELLFFQHRSLVDIVLCWDLLNYLSPEEFGEFLRRLSLRISPGAVVLTHLASSDMLSETPGCYSIVDGIRIGVEYPANSRISQCVRFSHLDFCRALPGATLECSVLLTNGLKEQSFICLSQ